MINLFVHVLWLRKMINVYTFCFQHFFLVNNLHTSWHPDIISLFKNFIFKKKYKLFLLQWQYNFMTISTLHSKKETDFSLIFFMIRSDSLESLLFLILYRTISFNWILKHFLNNLCQQSSITTESGRRSKIMLFVCLYLI